jgi:hypothetical protein
MFPLNVHLLSKVGKIAVEELDQHALKELRANLHVFQPRLRFAGLEELNGWLEAECRRWAERQHIPSKER